MNAQNTAESLDTNAIKGICGSPMTRFKSGREYFGGMRLEADRFKFILLIRST